MKTKIALGIASIAVAGLQLPAFADGHHPHIEVDYHEQTLAQEVLYGTVYDGEKLRVVTDPKGAALRRSFEFPIEMSVVQESSISTSTPITDRYEMGTFGDCNGDNRIDLSDSSDFHRNCTAKVTAWSEEVRECMASGPAMIRDLTGNEVNIYNSDGELLNGEIVYNASGKAVCSQFVGRAVPVSALRCGQVTVQQRTFSTPQRTYSAPAPAPVRGLY